MYNNSVELAKRLLVDSIWKSAQIEGLGTTYPKTEAILENIPTNTSREEVMFILNMRDAWNFLLHDALGYENSVFLLRELNKKVGRDLFYGAGEIRTTAVKIGGTAWTPNIPFYNDIVDEIESISKIDDVVLRALKYFCFVARTQIFIDGNKRVAQLIANKILIENDLGIFQVPVALVEDFKTKLLRFYETGDDSDLITFLKVNCIVKPDVVSVQTSSSEPIFSVRKESFDLSIKQLDMFYNVLKNLISLLDSLGESKCYLYEKNNVVYLEGRVLEVQVDLHSLKIKGNVVGDSERLRIYIIKTVELIEKNIPIPLKRLSFSVCREFASGVIRKSEDEEGSSDVILRG